METYGQCHGQQWGMETMEKYMQIVGKLDKLTVLGKLRACRNAVLGSYRNFSNGAEPTS